MLRGLGVGLDRGEGRGEGTEGGARKSAEDESARGAGAGRWCISSGSGRGDASVGGDGGV